MRPYKLTAPHVQVLNTSLLLLIPIELIFMYSVKLLSSNEAYYLISILILFIGFTPYLYYINKHNIDMDT